ncbi:MAG: alpha/beta-hydrolase N-terminal domain-containing protein, partial [Minisyncoccia bacterium]
MYKKNVGKIWNKIKKFLTQWSSLGLFFGFILFGISLSPSLVPRPFMLQGVVSGLVLTLGYGLGFSIMGIWRFMQLPELTGKTLRWAQLVLGIFVSTLVIYFFANTVYWQNSVRSLMDMDPIDETATIRIILVALLLWVFTIYLAIGVRKLYTLSVKKIHNIIPRRISYVIGSALLTFILFFLVNGLLVSKVIDFADDMYAKVDQAIPGDLTAPEKPTRSGSPDSFVAWDELGREGKYFVTGGPNKEKIARTTNKPSQEPIRLYVGLSAAPTPEQQAELALAELKRSKSFERKKIVIATPTGTGWIDDGAVDSFEYLHGGDTSIVAVQYSYLSSPVTLILDPDRARISARAVFNTVYGYWKTLPKESRPELYI